MYNRFDTRSILMLILMIMLIRGFANFDPQEFIDILYMLPGLILGLTIHEFSHAKMSDKLRRSYS